MRFSSNPLITPRDIQPTTQGFEVFSVLNPGACRFNGEILLLLRVVERPIQRKGYLSIGVLDGESGGYKRLDFALDDPLLVYDDPRVVKYAGVTYLTGISHLRVARSRNGVDFKIDANPTLMPSTYEECYSIEDARITQIGDTYYVYYVAVADFGFSTILLKTTDFIKFERIGNIFPGVNKDVAIFPEKINGSYAALHRPDTGLFANPSMWLAYSPDLVHWGRYSLLMQPRAGKWDSSRIGAGTVPLKTEKGWLEIYHGADENHRYSLGVLLLDADDPSKILYRDSKPILEPAMDYETDGFFKDVVFTNGMVVSPEDPNKMFIYYGSADERVCGAVLMLDQLIDRCNCTTRVARHKVVLSRL